MKRRSSLLRKAVQGAAQEVLLDPPATAHCPLAEYSRARELYAALSSSSLCLACPALQSSGKDVATGAPVTPVNS